MKKTIFFLFLLAVISLNAQERKAAVDLSAEQKEFITQLKRVNGHKDMSIPEKLVPVYKDELFLYAEFSDKSNYYRFMPDGELRIYKPLNDGFITPDYIIYLRLLNGKIFGYSSRILENGTISINVYKGVFPRIDNYEFKKD